MDDLDPSKADSVGDLAACLMRVRLCAGEPAYRALERQTLHASGLLLGTRLERVRLTRSTLSDVLRGRKFPSKAFLLTFVDACGIDLETDPRWAQAWDRLAVQDQQAGPAAEEVERLRWRTKNSASNSPRPSIRSKPPELKPRTIWASTWPWPASEPKDDKACSTRT